MRKRKASGRLLHLRKIFLRPGNIRAGGVAVDKEFKLGFCQGGLPHFHIGHSDFKLACVGFCAVFKVEHFFERRDCIGIIPLGIITFADPIIAVVGIRALRILLENIGKNLERLVVISCIENPKRILVGIVFG